VYSWSLVTASSTPTSSTSTSTMHAFASSWTSRRNQLHMCYTISIRIASLLAHADVWICSFIVFLACVGFIDPSCDFVVLVYLFLVASSISRIKLILNHEILQ
jgi:hypothetical protein